MSVPIRDLIRFDWRVAVVALLVAIPIGVAQSLGTVLADQALSGAPFGTYRSQLLTEAVKMTVIMFVLLVPAYNYVRFRRSNPVQRVSNSRFFIISMAVMIIGWWPYWQLMWPGHATADSYTQLTQVLGQAPLSDHHPILMTLVIGAWLLPLKAITGSIATSLGIMSAIQLVMFAAIFAHSITLLRRFKAPGGLYIGVVVFLAVNPVIGWYSISLWKDVWMGAFVLWAAALGVTLLADLWADQAIGWPRWLLFGCQLVLICAAKKNGIYMVAVLTVLLIAVALWRRAEGWGQRLRTARPVAIATVGALVAFVGIHTGVMTALKVAPGSPTEAFSLPVQQMARIVAEHGDSLTAEQQAELDRWFNGEDIGQRYDQRVSDNVKTVINRDLLKQEGAGGFIALWWDLVTDYPTTAALATAHGTQGYWYPAVKYWMVSKWTWPCMVDERGNVQQDTGEPIDETFDQTLVPVIGCYEGDAVEAVQGINEGLKSIPWLVWLFSLGLWAWAALILSGALLLLRRMAALPAVALMWLVWGTCMISPVYAESRYAYPMLLLLPVLLILTLAAPVDQEDPVTAAATQSE